MKIHLQDPSSSPNLIRAHQPAAITVGEVVYTASLIISPDVLLPDWSPATFTELEAAHIESLLQLSPELVLIGTGRRQQFPSPEILRPLIRAQVGYEIMDTGAACRTYNVLMAEGREIVAGLIVQG